MTDIPQTSAHHCAPDKRKYVLITAILASALGFIDGSIVSIAIPQIRQSLDASFAQAQWVHNAYILFLAAFILVGGAAGDRFGIRRTFGFGIGLFIAASQLCAVAWSPESLIVFRMLQGMGAAIMVPGSMSIIARNFPREERGKALGIWVAASSITTSMGPLLGGLLLSQADGEIWRFIFAINLPLGGLALALLWWQVPNDAPRERKRLDLMGAVLVTLSLGAIAGGLTLYGEAGGGLGSLVIFGTGLVLLVFALLWEWRTPHAMIDLALFTERTFWGGNVFTFLVWMGLGTLFFYLPMTVVVGWQMSEFYAGLMFLPFSAVIATLSPIVGRYVDKLGPRPFLIAGGIFSVIGYASMSRAVWVQDYWYGVLPSQFLIGISLGLAGSTVAVAVLSAVPDDKSGVASGINNMVARMSGLIGVAALGILVAAVYVASVMESGLPADIAAMVAQAGFGERLTGGLYQISTQTAQTLGMNAAVATLCATLSVLSFVGVVVAWFTIAPVAKNQAADALN
ncbi:MFS transporter [Pseudahrensia aquimaris]|uniref:MFS transporter n=1 Tax=Pseudahrensia aquimaris TaxID=744461 RepID=A0ABW3FFB7_9HYPH